MASKSRLISVGKWTAVLTTKESQRPLRLTSFFLPKGCGDVVKLSTNPLIVFEATVHFGEDVGTLLEMKMVGH